MLTIWIHKYFCPISPYSTRATIALFLFTIILFSTTLIFCLTLFLPSTTIFGDLEGLLLLSILSLDRLASLIELLISLLSCLRPIALLIALLHFFTHLPLAYFLLILPDTQIEELIKFLCRCRYTLSNW